MAEKKSGVSHDGHRQRMKERFLKEGLENFQGHEVLEMLLFYALPYRDTNDLGHRLIDRFGCLANVLDANYADLVKVDGITPHVATLLTMSGQLAQRYYREHGQKAATELYDPEKVGQYITSFFLGKKEESVVMLSMDNRFKLLNATRIFSGSVNSAQFNYRLAVTQALQDNATTVILAHNHPNGFAIPSAADVETTRQFASVLKLMDIRLADHLIVADNDYVSMAQSATYRELFGIGVRGK